MLVYSVVLSVEKWVYQCRLYGGYVGFYKNLEETQDEFINLHVSHKKRRNSQSIGSKEWNVEAIFRTPCHHRSNGLAEIFIYQKTNASKM